MKPGAQEQYDSFEVAWSKLTEGAKKRVRQKAKWEGCTLSAVRRDWPDLFRTEAEQGPDSSAGESGEVAAPVGGEQ